MLIRIVMQKDGEVRAAPRLAASKSLVTPALNNWNRYCASEWWIEESNVSGRRRRKRRVDVGPRTGSCVVIILFGEDSDGLIDILRCWSSVSFPSSSNPFPAEWVWRSGVGGAATKLPPPPSGISVTRIPCVKWYRFPEQIYLKF